MNKESPTDDEKKHAAKLDRQAEANFQRALEAKQELYRKLVPNYQQTRAGFHKVCLEISKMTGDPLAYVLHGLSCREFNHYLKACTWVEIPTAIMIGEAYVRLSTKLTEAERVSQIQHLIDRSQWNSWAAVKTALSRQGITLDSLRQKVS